MIKPLSYWTLRSKVKYPQIQIQPFGWIFLLFYKVSLCKKQTLPWRALARFARIAERLRAFAVAFAVATAYFGGFSSLRAVFAKTAWQSKKSLWIGFRACLCAAQSRRRYSLRLFLCLKFFALNHKIKFLKFLVIPCNEPLNLSYRLFCQNDKVPKNSKRILNSVDFSLTLKMTMFEIFAFYRKLKMTKSPKIQSVS